ncbi:MAG: anhydro-N-acetylmuramic acid kinase [Bryobacteraceae bacterium]|nr:anhydro-N-acetylmuramic acid kinase [Bryobacteraceae bacterium]
MRVAGIMSGTSLDGVDVALVDIDDDGFDTVGFHTVAYPEPLRAALLAVSNCETHTREISRLNFLLPEIYAEAFFDACKVAGIDPKSVDLIGCHGQTIFHESEPVEVLGRKVASTLQIGDGCVLAERTGVPVVSDFRPRDMAAGGKGAPLVPFVDYLLFRSDEFGRVALNIGGISNVTILPAGCTTDGVVAFDTGPGNMVMDQLAAKYSGGKKRCDEGGELALAGEVDGELLAELLEDEYYTRKPPKTAGREQYGAQFVDRLIAKGLSETDTMATATMLTAATVADGVYQFSDAEEGGIGEVIVSGGGVHNPALMRMLRAELADMEVVDASELGLDPDAKEAIAFAILAHETWHTRPNNLASATGARRGAVLGKLSR